MALAGLALGTALAWGLSRSEEPEAYRAVAGWPALPADVRLGEVSGVGIGAGGDVLVFRRAGRAWEAAEGPGSPATIAASTLLAVDAETGELHDSQGAGTFAMPHGLAVDRAGHVWVTDVALHQVFELDRHGAVLRTLGERGVPGDDGRHFDRPTDVAFGPDGSIYVSDGYGNARVARFSADGRFLGEWGSHGSGPGQFDLPHAIAADARGRVYVADRGNARVQVFDPGGRLLDVWQGAEYGRPWAVRVGPDGRVYVVDGGDQGPPPDRSRIVVCDRDGNVLDTFGSYGAGPGQFVWPHAIAIGADGSLYVGEVAGGSRVQKLARRS